MGHAKAIASGQVLTKDTQAILDEAEELLEKWKHPDPFRHPTAPGGLSHADTICVTALTSCRLEIRTKSAFTTAEP
jgi:hypothetical protein